MITQASRKIEVYEAITAQVCRCDRETMVERLMHFDGDLTLDFSREYLEECSTDQIRHLLVAALWRCHIKGTERTAVEDYLEGAAGES